MSPTVLGQALALLPPQHDQNLLVDTSTADDAGVYKVTDEIALVQTVDFFTPIVDDPYTFGEIAAANALSDVYAMGGKPVSSLALVCFPEKEDPSILEQILAGGLSKMVEAGCTVLGGHSIRDEIKFGYSVTGTIDPRRVLTNAGAKAGDSLVLTKPVGTGVISTAIKKREAMPDWVDASVSSMTSLNRRAAEISLQHDVHAMTDVTGFGLIGHRREMALGSRASLRFFASTVPLLPGALECVERGFIPGGLNNNYEFASCCVQAASSVLQEIQTLFYDPQTSGGLLIALDPSNASA